MVWVRIDDQFPEHPKVAQAGPLAMAMQVAGLCYCNRKLTDGFIPRSIAKRLIDFEVLTGDGKIHTLARTCGMVGDDLDADWVIDLLVESGMWYEVDAGYVIHDYHEFQPSRQEVQDERQQKSEAGKKGAAARWGPKTDDSHSSSNGTRDGTSHGDRDSGTMAEPCPVPGPVPEPSENLNPSPPDGGRDSGETDADDPLHDDASDEIARQFEEHFWPVYPPTNGRKPEKGKALTQWRKLTVEQRRRAVTGARNLSRSDTVPKYAHRFLRKDTSGEFPFDDWQQREGGGPEPIAPDACQECGQGKTNHDAQLCEILAKAG